MFEPGKKLQKKERKRVLVRSVESLQHTGTLSEAAAVPDTIAQGK
jgi:hypothetical protein